MPKRKTKPAMSRRPAMKPILIAGLTVFATAAVLAWLHFFGRPPAGPPVTVIIEPGSSLQSIAQLLETNGLVSSSNGFIVASEAKGLANRIRAGEFSIPRGLDPKEVAERLVFGPVVQHKITIPEGYTVRQIAELIVEKGIDNASAVKALETNPDFAKSLDLPAESLEGYLFPDTYQYTRGYPAKELLTAMVERFRRVYDQRMRAREAEMGLTTHQVVTLASIVERETAVGSERPRIAAVFYNRLKKGMMLQSDPTVIYGIGERFNGNLTRHDLMTPTPFNTYTRRGLPPGPIANPGKASLEAALWPATTDELYFVSRNDGTHVFNVDYDKHLAAVNQYQRGKSLK
jgi:UPF0755 protein